MSVRGGQSVTVDFTTRNSSGALANADSLPAGKVVVNGADNAATVTVTNKATGVYSAAVTLPALAVGDVVQLRVNAAVGGVADGDYVWEDSADIAVTAAGKVPVAQLAAADFAAGALNGKGDWSLAGVAPSWYVAPVDVSANVAAVKAKTDNLPADPAGLAGLAAAHGGGSWATATGFAVPGSAMTLAAGAITEATITPPAEAAGAPTGILGMVRWLAARLGLRRVVRDGNAGTLKTYLANGTTVMTTQNYTSAGGVDDVGAAS